MFENDGLPPFFDDNMFGGLYQDEFSCRCGNKHESPVQKLSEIIPLDVIGEDIQQCLENCFLSEKVERACVNCGCQIGEKKTTFISEPATLILLLKRYKFNKEQCLKKNSKVKCLKKLNLPSGSIFTMSSVINHFGETPEEGHYNVLLYDEFNDKFFALDDMKITSYSSIPESFFKAHYIAVYRKTI